MATRLRAYQKRAVQRARKHLEKRERVLVVSPGGSGKTVMIANLARLEMTSGKRVLCLSHRRELVNQCYEHLLREGVKGEDLGVIMSDDVRLNSKASIQVASIDTIIRRDYPAVDVVVMDEAHHCPAETWTDLVEYYSDTMVVGFTATPYRLDGRGLGDVFDVLIEAVKPSELLRKKWMSRPVIFSPGEDHLPNLKGLRTLYGDYALSYLVKEVSKETLVGDIFDHWFEHAKDKITLIYAVSVSHSQLIVDRFVKKGVQAEHIDGSMSTGVRDEILRRLVSGETRVVSSCMILSEGYNLPQCGAIVLARPTKSLALATQQVNRGLRYYKGERTVVLDHAGHYLSFGLPYIDREFSLYKTQEKLMEEGRARRCPECGIVVPIGTRICSECGCELYNKPLRDFPIEEDGELVRLTPKSLQEMEGRLQAMAKKKGFPKTWVQDVMARWIAARS